MSSQGTPNSGLAELAHRCFVLGDALSLVAYTNPLDSLGANTVAADLVEPPLANGYAAIILDPTGWTILGGLSTYVHAAPNNINGNPAWSATGSWGADPVNGFALVYGTACIGFRDRQTPWVAAAGRKIEQRIMELLGA